MKVAAFLLSLVLATGCSSSSSVPTPTPVGPLSASQAQALDALAGNLVTSNLTPGIAIGIARNGTTIYLKAFGSRSLSPAQPALTTTPFAIGSVTKQFTTAAILLLVQDGKISLDDKLSKYVPDYKPSALMTIRQLMTMTAGVPSHDADIYNQLDPSAPPSQTILAALNSLPLDFTPGTQMAYSNYGIWLLGETVRRVSGMAFGDFLNARILAPLGMTSTYLYGTRNGPNEATGYAHQNQSDPFVPAPDPPSQYIDAQGGLTSTLGDVLAWDAALTTQKVVQTPLYATWLTVPQLPGGGTIPTYTGVGDGGGESIQRLNDGSPSMYAMGWFNPGSNYFWHSGGTNGFTSMNACFNDGTSIVILTNHHLGSKPVGDAIPNLAAALYNVLNPSATTPNAFTILRLPSGQPTPNPPE